MNESFSSTALADARALGAAILAQVLAIGAVGVYVTFIDELASLSAGIVSMVATVQEDDPDSRTFQVVRGPANGRAYTEALARRHGLTYEGLRRSLPR